MTERIFTCTIEKVIETPEGTAYYVTLPNGWTLSVVQQMLQPQTDLLLKIGTRIKITCANFYNVQKAETVEPIPGAQYNDQRSDRAAGTKQPEIKARIEALVSSVAFTVRDYQPESAPVTEQRILDWVNQFPYTCENEKLILIGELDLLLRRYYFSKERVVAWIYQVLDQLWLEKGARIEEINFIENQKYGQSQREMLVLVGEALDEKYRIKIENCGGSKEYIYLDDGLFSGTRLIKDFENWIEGGGRQGTTFHILYPVVHTSGWARSYNQVSEKARDAAIQVEYAAPALKIQNAKSINSIIECYWPKASPHCHPVQEYIEQLTGLRVEKNFDPDRIFRPPRIPNREQVFSSPEARDLIERLLLRVGVGIINAMCYREDIRPLGFDNLLTLGFGSLFISYRNIANSCPLAFWFDGARFNRNWVPLFARRGNFADQWWS